MADARMVRHMQLEGFIDEIAQRAVKYIESSDDKSTNTIDYLSHGSRKKLLISSCLSKAGGQKEF